MTGAGYVYGEALYSLAREESLTESFLQELETIRDLMVQEPDFLRLLNSTNLSREERCDIIDKCFRGKVHDYILNFMKLMVEKGRIGQFPQSVLRFRELYNEEHGILPVRATTAVALTREQSERLTEKLSGIIGKQVLLTNRVDPAILGGICLDYDGKRIDDTVAHRLDSVKDLLVNTVL